MRPGKQVLYDNDNQIDVREDGLVITIWDGNKVENQIKQGSDHTLEIFQETIRRIKARKKSMLKL